MAPRPPLPRQRRGGADFELALDAVARTCDGIEHPRSRALVRMDGEHGHVPWFTTCRERGLPFITRPMVFEPATDRRRWTRIDAGDVDGDGDDDLVLGAVGTLVDGSPPPCPSSCS